MIYELVLQNFNCSLEFVVFFSAITSAFQLFTCKLCLQFSGLRMRNFMWNRTFWKLVFYKQNLQECSYFYAFGQILLNLHTFGSELMKRKKSMKLVILSKISNFTNSWTYLNNISRIFVTCLPSTETNFLGTHSHTKTKIIIY